VHSLRGSTYLGVFRTSALHIIVVGAAQHDHSQGHSFKAIWYFKSSMGLGVKCLSGTLQQSVLGSMKTSLRVRTLTLTLLLVLFQQLHFSAVHAQWRCASAEEMTSVEEEQ
jgi:hypothetical protein